MSRSRALVRLAGRVHAGVMLGELNTREIDAVLHTSVVGRIGCHSDGRTYIVPITYAFDGDSVYAHSAAGTKVEMMRANPAVCFEVEQLDDLANWRTVVAWGEFEELHGADADDGLRKLLARLAPYVTSTTAQPVSGPDGTFHGIRTTASEPVPPSAGRVAASGQAPVLYRIRLTEKTGRFEERSTSGSERRTAQAGDMYT